MTALEAQQREKLKERLVAFLKTLPGLVAENDWKTFDLRVENCLQIEREILEIGKGVGR